MYTALHRDDFIYSTGSSTRSWPSSSSCIDPTMPEGAVVWQGGLVVAVVLAAGRVIRLDALPLPHAA